MRRILLAVVVVAVLVVFGLLAWLNPGGVDFRFASDRSLRAPLGWLLIFAFVAGAGIAALAASLQRLGARLATIGERRRTKQALQVGEWQESGTALAWDGELDRGRSLLRKAWRRQPHNAAAALALASSYLDTAEYGAARLVLEEALAHDANDADLRFALGELLRRSGQRAEAIRMLETVHVQHPRSPRVLLALRDLYRESGAWSDAARTQEVYLHCLPEAGRNETEREHLLHLHYQTALAEADPERRLAALEAVAQEDRSFLPALVSWGDALVEAGRADEARKLWERALRSHAQLVLVDRLLTQADSGRERQRVLALAQKYRDGFDADGLHLLIARAALADGEVDTAAAELQAVSKQDTPITQREWAEVFRRRGQLEEALQSLQRAAQTPPSSAATYQCVSCKRLREGWSGYCAACQHWDTYRLCA
jgi:tetratricopeptide (TPR) repeat protein